MTGWAQVRIAAAIMLALYAGLAAVLSARELRFLASVEPRQRRLFLTQDILVQLAILGVLVPCALAPQPTAALFTLIMAAFALLWVAALWAVAARSMYTYRLMLQARGERKDFEELLRGSGADTPVCLGGPRDNADKSVCATKQEDGDA